MKRVAITGISGYIGHLLLQRLERQEDVESIIGIDLRAPSSASPKLKFYPRDIREPFADILADNQIDTAVHLAFVVRPTHDCTGAHRIAIEGSRNFLEACQQASVECLLYLSSHLVYGPHSDNPIPITEESPLRPIRSFPYSWDKAEVDRMFQDFMKRSPDTCSIIVRTCAVTGPKGGGAGLTNLFTPVMIRPMGYDPPWQFVHEDDLTELISTLLSQKQKGIFNSAGDGFLRYREIIAAIGKPSVALPASLLSLLINLTWQLHLQSNSPAGGLEMIKYPIVISAEKVKKTTGFQFRYSSREALMSLIDTKRSTS
jgi:UDP-glucose 4-epimerase